MTQFLSTVVQIFMVPELSSSVTQSTMHLRRIPLGDTLEAVHAILKQNTISQKLGALLTAV